MESYELREEALICVSDGPEGQNEQYVINDFVW